MAGGFVAFRAAARGQFIDGAKVTARGFGHLGQHVGEMVAILDRVRHTRTLTGEGQRRTHLAAWSRQISRPSPDTRSIPTPGCHGHRRVRFPAREYA